MFMLEASQDGERSLSRCRNTHTHVHTTPCVANVVHAQCAGPHPEDQRPDLQCTVATLIIEDHVVTMVTLTNTHGVMPELSRSAADYVP